MFYLLTVSSDLSIDVFFDIEVMYLKILFIKVLIHLSATTDFLLRYVLNTFLYYYLATTISLIYYKIPLYTLILFALELDSFNIFWRALVIVLLFLSFIGITHAYLLKISITHNKKWISLLHLLINCISARSAPQILSIKGESVFIFWNFLIIGLCNSSPNSLFETFSFLIPLLGDFLSKICKPLK